LTIVFRIWTNSIAAAAAYVKHILIQIYDCICDIILGIQTGANISTTRKHLLFLVGESANVLQFSCNLDNIILN